MTAREQPSPARTGRWWRAGARALTAAAAVAALGWLAAPTAQKYLASSAERPLRVSFFGPFQELRLWQAMLKDFEQKHPDIPVKIQYYNARYTQKIGQMLVADDAPDVIMYEDEPFPNLIERDPERGIEAQFADLTELAAEYDEPFGRDDLLREFWRTGVDSFGQWEVRGGVRDWHQYGLPLWGGPSLIYYNKDCFRRCGITLAELEGDRGLVPDPDGEGWLLDDNKWDLSDFVKVCQLLTLDWDNDGRIDQYGFTLGWYVHWLPMHYASGAGMLNEDRTHLTFMGPEVEASLQLWQDLVFGMRVSPREAELGQMSAQLSVFTGRVAMFCNGPRYMLFLNESGVNYDVLHVPRHPETRERATRITWDAVAVWSGSTRKRDAWLLVKHLVSRENMEVAGRTQRSIPGLKAAQASFSETPSRVTVEKFVEATEYARMQPITRHWPVMERAWETAMLDLRRDDAAKRLSPQEAIGQFLSDRALRERLPPADPDLADGYIAAYRAKIGQSTGGTP